MTDPTAAPQPDADESAAIAPLPPVQKASSLRHFCAGAVAGTVAAVALNPLDVMRVRMQSSQVAHTRPRATTVFANMLKNEGPTAFYRGLGMSIVGVGPARALYFGGYNVAKKRLGTDGWLGLTGMPLDLISAAVAGIAANTIMSPWWVVRTRLQLQHTPISPVFRRAQHVNRLEAPGTMPPPPSGTGAALPGAASGAASAAASHAAGASASAPRVASLVAFPQQLLQRADAHHQLNSVTIAGRPLRASAAATVVDALTGGIRAAAVDTAARTGVGFVATAAAAVRPAGSDLLHALLPRGAGAAAAGAPRAAAASASVATAALSPLAAVAAAASQGHFATLPQLPRAPTAPLAAVPAASATPAAAAIVVRGFGQLSTQMRDLIAGTSSTSTSSSSSSGGADPRSGARLGAAAAGGGGGGFGRAVHAASSGMTTAADTGGFAFGTHSRGSVAWPPHPMASFLQRARAVLGVGGGGGGGGGARPLATVASTTANASASVASSTTVVNAGYTGALDCMGRIIREEGWRALYRGLTASYLGVIETAVQFALYGAMKDAVVKWRVLELERIAVAASSSNGGPPLPVPSPEELRSRAYTPHLMFLTSAASKLVAAALTYPHEVIRTRMREQRGSDTSGMKYRGLLQTARTIAREEGLRGLYGGMSIHMVRTVPNAAIIMFVVESIVGGDL